MADLVVGMAKSVVDGALTKAQAAIEEEAKLRQSAQRNLVFITGEFQMMQSFLKVAKGERLENVVVKTWVRQIRDLAYDVEDCIEFVVHLDKRNRWWVRLLQPGRWFMPCLPPLRVDEAVAELELLKARVEDVSARNARYSLIGDSGSKPAVAEHQPASHDAGGVAMTAFDRIFVAAGTEKGNLTDLVPTKESGGDLQVIAVWGSSGGDLGMTSVVWNAYTNKKICEGFPCRAWIKLSRPFNRHEFIWSLASQLFSSTCKEQSGGVIALDVGNKIEAKQGDLLAEFRQHVDKQRFLVVLEDLASMEEWNAVTKLFPHKGENGSCIIVSTLNFEVASLSVGHPYRVLHLNNQLSAQHSVYGFHKMETQRDGDKGKKTVADPGPSGSSKKEKAAEWMKEHDPLVGRESETHDLGERAVAAARKYKVMSVWGIAGVGKSSVVKHMFCDKIINSEMFQKYAWVEVSRPFNIREFSRSLLLSFDSEVLQTKVIAEHGTVGGSMDPIEECREMLKNQSQRCLIVFDGLQSTTDWDCIKAELLPAKHRNAIVVITSEESIARHCCGPKGPYTYNVKGLGRDAASRLFAKEFNNTAPPDAYNDVRELVLRCGGLPKVIVEISRSLAKNKFEWKERVRSINNQFIQELNNGEFSELQDLFCWMELYFRNCPDSLKPCILYLSIFSSDLVIRRRRLVRRWIAEGYSKDSHEESAEEKGEKQFLNLHNLSIIQPSSLGYGDTRTRIVSCQVNGFFREYIISQQMEDSLVFELDGHCAVTTQRTGRHLCISQGWDRDRIVFDNIDFSKLRSLTVSGKWESFFISKSMKLLRVLDLENASGVKFRDLEKISKWFPRIKFLSLRGQTKIFHLPSSIGDLRQLQTLDVRHTSIKTLPVNIIKLQNLQYLRAGSTSPEGQKPSTQRLPLCGFSDYWRSHHRAGVKMPPGFRKLTALHTLGVVNVSASGTKAILELTKITQLCKLGVSGINKRNSKMFFSAIKDLVHLESLSVWIDKNSESCLDDISLPPKSLPSLRSLKLHGIGDKLPEWRELFTMLTKIDLEMTTVKSDIHWVSMKEKTIADEGVIVFLGGLSELCILRIRVKQFQGDNLNVMVVKHKVEAESFENVRILEIASSCSTDVTFGKKTMKNLQQLKFDCSSGSRYKFAGLEHLRQLKELKFV